MASSSGKGSKGPTYDPREYQLNRATIYGKRVQEGQQSSANAANDIETMIQEYVATQAQEKQAAAAKAYADGVKLDARIAARNRQEAAEATSILRGAAADEAKARLQHEAKTAKAQQQQKQPSAQDVVASALSGQEVGAINPLKPMSTAPKVDATGGGAAEAIQYAVQGGRGVQQQQGPLSVQMGGQTFQAPEEIVRRSASLGAHPVRLLAGYGMAPTFQMETTREPNVLTAANIAELQARQQEQVLSRAIEMGISSDAPTDQALTAFETYYKTGDSGQVQALARQYPAFAKEAAKLEIENQRLQGGLIRAETARSAAAAGYDRTRTAIMQLQATGYFQAQDWLSAIGLNGPAGTSMPIPGTKGQTTMGADTDFSKLPVVDIVDKDGNVDPAGFIQYQLGMVRQTGMLPYRIDKSAFPGASAEFAFVSMPEMYTNLAVAMDLNNTIAARNKAIDALEQLPFLEVTRPRKPGDHTIVGWNKTSGEQGAAPMVSEAVLRTIVNVNEGRVQFHPWMVDEGARKALAQYNTAKVSQAAPAAPGKPLTPYERGRAARERAASVAEAAKKGAVSGAKRLAAPFTPEAQEASKEVWRGLFGVPPGGHPAQSRPSTPPYVRPTRQPKPTPKTPRLRGKK